MLITCTLDNGDFVISHKTTNGGMISPETSWMRKNYLQQLFQKEWQDVESIVELQLPLCMLLKTYLDEANTK